MSPVQLDAHPGIRPVGPVDTLRTTWHDGRLLTGSGVVLIGAVLADTIRWLASMEDRMVAFPALMVVGAGLLGWGIRQRRSDKRQARTAAVVGVWDPAGAAGGKDRIARVVAHSQHHHDLTLTVMADLAEAAADLPFARRLAECTSRAIGLADRFRAGSDRIDLYPMLRVHLGFWLGAAAIGRSQHTPIGLWQSDEAGDYLATVLTGPVPATPSDRRAQQPFVPSVESLTAGPVVRVALSVSVRPRDAASDERLRSKCGELGVDQVLWLRATSDALGRDTEAVTAALDQVEREWLGRLPPTAATFLVFLDTTVTLAVGLGARLAGTDLPRWTALTIDRTGNGGFLQFPPAGSEES